MRSNTLKAVGGALANIATLTGYGAKKEATIRRPRSRQAPPTLANAPEQKVITTETKDVSQAEDAVNSSARR
ncbi:hypothetical protein, partial [Akkermansia muciniphila]|uniref:hypothetical protein n=1 Tax=Akkermansia muciniphila TaxID=239935 RepID=UPI001C9DD518